jgi:glycerophosphoryl diester phosphodiesterase
VEFCHKYNIAVNCWTVNDPADIGIMVDMHVDGIITNYPDVALSVVSSKK